MICRVFSVPLIQLRLFCSTVLYQWMLALYLPLSWLPRPCTGMLAVWVQGLLYLLASLLYCLGPGRWQKVGCQCVLLRRKEWRHDWILGGQCYRQRFAQGDSCGHCVSVQICFLCFLIFPVSGLESWAWFCYSSAVDFFPVLAFLFLHLIFFPNCLSAACVMSTFKA